MTESFVLNLGRTGTIVNRDDTPESYESYTSSDDLIIKGYIVTDISESESNAPEIHISNDEIKKYMIGVITAAVPDAIIDPANTSIRALVSDSGDETIITITSLV